MTGIGSGVGGVPAGLQPWWNLRGEIREPSNRPGAPLRRRRRHALRVRGYHLGPGHRKPNHLLAGGTKMVTGIGYDCGIDVHRRARSGETTPKARGSQRVRGGRGCCLKSRVSFSSKGIRSLRFCTRQRRQAPTASSAVIRWARRSSGPTACSSRSRVSSPSGDSPCCASTSAVRGRAGGTSCTPTSSPGSPTSTERSMPCARPCRA